MCLSAAGPGAALDARHCALPAAVPNLRALCYSAAAGYLAPRRGCGTWTTPSGPWGSRGSRSTMATWVPYWVTSSGSRCAARPPHSTALLRRMRRLRPSAVCDGLIAGACARTQWHGQDAFSYMVIGAGMGLPWVPSFRWEGRPPWPDTPPGTDKPIEFELPDDWPESLRKQKSAQAAPAAQYGVRPAGVHVSVTHLTKQLASRCWSSSTLSRRTPAWRRLAVVQGAVHPAALPRAGECHGRAHLPLSGPPRW